MAMKKATLTAATVAGMFLTACWSNKDWQCKCTEQGGDVDYHLFTDQTQSDAEALCSWVEDEYNYVSCNLKEIQ